MVYPKIVPKRKKPVLAIFDGGSIVIALFHGLQYLLFAQGELVLFETGRAEYFSQNGQSFG